MANWLTHNNIIQADVFISMPESQEAHNIYTYQRNDAEEDDLNLHPTMVALTAALTSFYTECAPLMHPDVSVEYIVYRIGEWEEEDGVYSWHYSSEIQRDYLNIDGTSTGQMLPHQCAMLLTADTDRPKTLGKKYIPGITEEHQDSGRWITSALLGAVDILVEYLLPIVVADFGLAPGVASKIGTFVPFVSGVIGEIVSSQRRRKIGVGV